MKVYFNLPDVRLAAALAAVLLLVAPQLLDPFRLNLAGKYLSFAFVALGIVLAWGYGGVLSLGQGIFFGAGGYMMAMFLKLEASGAALPDFMAWSGVTALPWWWQPFHSLPATLALVLLLPPLAAALFAYPIFRRRVSGVYFALVTLALALAMSVLIVGQQGGTGGSNGITDFQTILGFDMGSDAGKRTLYYAQAVCLDLAMAVALSLVHSRYGKVLVAIREREDRVRFSGYDTALFKCFVFAVSAALASVGGAFYCLQAGLVSPGVVGVVPSIEMVVYAAVGGRLSVPGAVIGALLVGFLKSWLSESFPEAWLYLLGSLFILVVAVMPHGVAGLPAQLAMALGRRGAQA
ncbi:MAG: urea ABC transporter permease subunit UrtC [Pseudomonadota bacterium]